MQELSRALTLRMRDCDADGRWKRSALLLEMQELGETHASEMGFSRTRLTQEGMCWVLYRLVVRMDDEAVMGEAVRMTTWPGALSGLFFPRFHRFEKEGELLGEAAATWVLFDTQKRRVLRPSMLRGDYAPNTERTSGLALPGAITLGEVRDVEERCVRYSDLDANGHMNNARYADWVQDLLPGRRMGRLQINFMMEGRLGERIKLRMSEAEGHALFVGVREDGKALFEAEVDDE